MSRQASPLLAVLMVLLVSVTLVYAATFAYRYLDVGLRVEPPAVWFEDPVYPNVTVYLYNYKTRAHVVVNASNAGLRLINRTGYVFDLRDPVVVREYFEEWGDGCTYYYTDDGAGIQVRGNPAGGLYGGCVLRYKYPLEVVNMTFTVIMRTDDTDDTGTNYGIRGPILANSVTGYYYMAGLKNNKTGWFFGIYEYTGRTIREPGGPVLPALRDVQLTGVVAGVWFAVTVSYTVFLNGSSLVRAWLYNVTGGGRLVVYLEVLDPTPITGLNTFGVGVYQVVGRPSAVFQIVGFASEIYIIIIRGLSYCCYVYVYDSNGTLIGSTHVNETGIAEVVLANSAVFNATVRIVCGVHEFAVPLYTLLGGDVYEVYFWFEGRVLQVYTRVLNMSFTGWAVLWAYNCTGPIYYITVGLVNQTHASTVNVTIVQVGGVVVPISLETEKMLFTPLPPGWAGNITMRAELYYGSECNLVLLFNYAYSPGVMGVLRSELKVQAR